MATSNSTIDAEILSVVVDPDAATFKTPVARGMLSLQFTEKQRGEIQKLLDKNNAGTITRRERLRLEGYTRVGNFLSLVKAKARGSLSRHATKR